MRFFKRPADTATKDHDALWPTPEYDEGNQPHFLFVITPPYSGSTALARILNTSHRTALLQRRGEAQWLVPGLRDKRRWDADMAVDYRSVKAVWLSAFQRLQVLTQTTDTVIEKSPPNMVRIERLAEQFRDCSFIANNRDPYANCASILYRRHDADRLDPAQRGEALGRYAQRWIERSKRLRALVERLRCPVLTYEEFCRDPSSVVRILSLPAGVAETIDPTAEVEVKNYERQGIVSQNDRQISNLTEADREAITAALKRRGDGLLEFFHYALRG